MSPRPTKRPGALEKGADAYSTLESEIADTVRIMAKWPEVADAVTKWADSLTSTNCSWSDYGFAKKLIERWQQHRRSA